jgi:hypothetical protein
MSSPLEPIEICCDAPPYPVVQACRLFDIQSPEDVRWLRMRAFRRARNGRHQGFSWPFWKLFWKRGQHSSQTCTCGQPLPLLRWVVFSFNTGEQASYLLGQCSRCHTIFWDAP